MTDNDRHQSAADSATARRTVISGVAAGGLALPLLSACGSGSKPSSGGGGGGGSEATSTGSPSASAGGSGAAAAKGTSYPVSEIPVGGGKIDKGAKTVVTQPVKGQFKAFSAVCTHQGCLVSKVDKTIDCLCHGSEFSIEDGSVKQGPASQPLQAKKVTVSGSNVVVS